MFGTENKKFQSIKLTKQIYYNSVILKRTANIGHSVTLIANVGWSLGQSMYIILLLQNQFTLNCIIWYAIHNEMLKHL